MAASNFVVIWKTDVKWHADEYTYVKIKTGNRIPIRRPSVFLNLNLPPSMEGPLSVATWDDTAWIGGTASGVEYFYRSVVVPEKWHRHCRTHCLSDRMLAKPWRRLFLAAFGLNPLVVIAVLRDSVGIRYSRCPAWQIVVRLSVVS